MPLDGGALLEWASLTALVAENEPRYFRQLKFPESFVGDVAQLLTIIDDEASLEPGWEDLDDLANESQRMSNLAKALDILEGFFTSFKEQIQQTAERVAIQSHRLQSAYQSRSDEEGPDEYKDEISATSRAFDVESLFVDL